MAQRHLEAHVIGPRIAGHAVGLHPLGAIIALIAGVELYGLRRRSQGFFKDRPSF
jgi:predicted PurR-regulated permease PerM